MRFSVDGMGGSYVFFGWYDSLTLVVGDPATVDGALSWVKRASSSLIIASTSTSAYKHEELRLPLLTLNVPPCSWSLCPKLKGRRHRETTPPSRRCGRWEL